MRIVLAKAMSPLFEYPEPSYLSVLASLESESERLAPAAAESFHEFHSCLSTLTLEETRELYTKTFDLTPSCAPYLSVHLFGESSFKRARLMAGLAELYVSKGIETNHELPDHIGVVLRALEALDPTDQEEIVTHCLKACLEKMQIELQRQNNPYVYALAAVAKLSESWGKSPEVSHD
jgi:nitrate reductase delta subunit